jgi:hypothetical protein
MESKDLRHAHPFAIQPRMDGAPGLFSSHSQKSVILSAAEGPAFAFMNHSKRTDANNYAGSDDRARQISSRVAATVKLTGPRMMPVTPKRETPPMIESSTVTVWARSRAPTKIG